MKYPYVIFHELYFFTEWLSSAVGTNGRSVMSLYVIYTGVMNETCGNTNR